ncbi:ribonuclease catalytic domain-containing protein [Candidatus Kinetoplastidibacterium crithidiae]|uniref:Exoribonuclease II n=1 Tax=Candidatus Kinetoplastidibacterium crithidiae TCC036E TaxID=1208918 RepID=M1M738_9PROT|nr:RNB domain-containing ribonuclease [Candidatus Kinetoplastibacterium crithidii]AFZ82900.1 exoribonuclease II [Candidatus Kinetoplastibacterium crithidii (ex Angomonas deanei ATCC 30255)]AGF47900.1 exoribonuclease II [Candidatus Kinetoplastibacterium crithidii TCC036E]
MYVLYEDSGCLKTGAIISKTESNMLVETEHGKKIKLKTHSCLLQFNDPSPSKLINEATIIASTIDINFLWECASQDVFYAYELSAEYFGHDPSAIEQTAMLLKLHNSPIYFYKKGSGQYKSATKDKLLLAIAAIEKKKAQEEEEKKLVESLINGELPYIIKANALDLIIKPDKNTIYWKALEKACVILNKSPEKLLLELEAWPNLLTLLRKKFIKSNFPNGIDFQDNISANIIDDLPISDAEIYSIDDISTTEIDDGISVRKIDKDLTKVGIHIASPALGIQHGSILDQIARSRSSTIYLPGEKITMLPQKVIEEFSLQSGKLSPAISLYVTLDNNGTIVKSESLIEKVKVKENLRITDIENIFTESNLNNSDIDIPFSEWIRPLWKITQILSLKREQRRGYPENLSRPEYNFRIHGNTDDPNSVVIIEKRPRNNPVSKIVAEFMILANSIWANLLKEYGVAGIYRSQQTFGRVRMSTIPLPHEYIGVDQYIWSTSPLRRYIDLVNQWQIISIIKHSVSARLASPFKAKDSNLFSIIQEFEFKYNVICSFQNEIENFWSIQWLIQKKLEIINGYIIKENLVKIDEVPIIITVDNLPKLEKGTHIKIRIISINSSTLEIKTQYIETIDL